MLRNLTIRNYALIRDLDLEFDDGLTIITGETGAGKSIMLGALGLVMGGRADTKMISDGDARSVVEARFIDVDPELRELLEERGVEWVEEEGVSELTIRRELTRTARSRVFINDSSVTLQTLALIAPRLIDIHSQHANAEINNPAERLRIIDAIASNDELRDKYRALFDDYRRLRHEIETRRRRLEEATSNVDFLRFQLEQLDKLAPKRGELREIEQRYELLSDADEIKERVAALEVLLGDGATGVRTLLADASAIADKIGETLGNNLPARIRQLAIEAKDIFETVDDFYGSIDTDPRTLARLSERMNLYYDAISRFKVGDADELADLHASLRDQLNRIETGDDELPAMEREARRLGAELKACADSLTESRMTAAADFSRMIVEAAMPLGLPNIKFETEITPRRLCAAGQDEVQFLCSFNKNGTLRPVADIASGGEIARMMLSLKSIVAGRVNLPTIIFDEVDTGVSGEIADKMGKMMHNIAHNMQVIVITHLPQVAARGDSHFKVYKRDDDTRTETHVLRLGSEERVRELAAMISGSEVTEAALLAARALLGSGEGS